ncbi:hypothetical protein [Vibrio nigripulchritudo]|uniref:hypothetical protein n=1 Tax=Vibrio nigripulchritudo TaxID=28173 RepID=UPI0003B18A28|nr:hypothetical protein [Vibrio nigripulchritudo]CCN73093.1 exported hypothetical protein [Vibrio nigripulchritudo SFn118]
MVIFIRSLSNLLIAITLFVSFSVVAIDNPDKPEPVSQIDALSAPFIDKIEQVSGYRDTLLAYTDYHEFLSLQIKDTVSSLMSQLTETEKDSFKAGHEAWEKYIESQYEFIEQVWSKENFGTASAIDRGEFKARLLREKLIALHYYQNTLL